LQDKIAATITLEQGKTFEDAKGDVMRGLRKSVRTVVLFVTRAQSLAG